MKQKKTITLLVAAIATMGTALFAENVHQKTEGEQAYGKKELLEVKEVKGADGGKIARIKGDMSQWGFMSYWLGLPTPAGKSTIRIKAYVDKTPTAEYAIYKVSKGHQDFLKKIEIPKDAKPETFVTIDIPVESDTQWNGLAFKKFENCEDPSIWIDSISIITE